MALIKSLKSGAASLCGAAFMLSGAWVWAQAPIIDLSEAGVGRRAAPPPTNTAPASTPAASSGVDAGELLYQLQLMQQELMTLRGLVEQQGHELQQLRQQSMDRYIELDRRVSALQGTAPSALPERSTTEVDGGRRGSPPSLDSTSEPLPGEYEAYKAAYSRVKAQEFNGAIESFTRFLSDYPEGRYTPNAYYWLGELYLVLSPPQPDKAAEAFTQLLQRYPDNAKVPDAMFKLGRLYYEQGKRDRARQLMEQVVAEYKQQDSSAVALARQFLSEKF